MKTPPLPSRRSRGDFWRGDLLRVIEFFSEEDQGDVVAFANARGYEYSPPEDLPLALPKELVLDALTIDDEPEPKPQSDFHPELLEKHIIRRFWVPKVWFRNDPTPTISTESTKQLDTNFEIQFIPRNADDGLQERTMASWPELRNRLEPFLGNRQTTTRLDAEKLVNQLGRGEYVQRFPFVERKSVANEITIVRDLAVHCVPFRVDFMMLTKSLKSILRRGGIRVLEGDLPSSLVPVQEAKRDEELTDFISPRFEWEYEPLPGSHVLILSDLGLLLAPQSQSLVNGIRAWRTACERWTKQGCTLFALLPCSTERVPRELAHCVRPIAWQGDRIEELSPSRRDTAVRELMIRAFAARRIEPGLLREWRRLCPGLYDASIEAWFWQSTIHRGPDIEAVKTRSDSTHRDLEREFMRLEKETIQQILYWQRRYRIANECSVLWQMEWMNLPSKLRDTLDPDGTEKQFATKTFHALRYQQLNGGPYGLEDRLVDFSLAVTEHALEDEDLGETLQAIKSKSLPDTNLSSKTQYTVCLQGTAAGIEISGPDRSGQRSAFSGTSRQVTLLTGKRLLKIKIRVDTAPTHDLKRWEFWKSGRKPDWVSDFGTDEYGAWCEFQVPRHDGKGMVTQRMRWIKPGQFMMGSPDKEEGKYDDESPQHQVTLTQGYWMADSQVTQELWMAISGGENPSGFQGAANPVEQVSWKDCQAWISKLDLHHESLQISLPTEAQWEYACRAGSTTAYCFGDDPKELPKYGWFDGNSKDTTHPVKQLQPNNWGLYDMHGNGWEWCIDWYGEYEKSAQSDPAGPAKGTYRVLRGGGWFDPARLLRSACRVRSVPGDRDDSLGFRLLSSAQGAEPSERAMLPVAEQGTELARIGTAEPAYEFLRSVDLDATGENSPEEEFSSMDFQSYSSIRVVSDQEGYQFDRLEKPAWAVDFGSDAFGLYATFELSTVRQRMRWIPPGRFMMGSPVGKDYGLGDEDPQHEVIITHGYWMFDTPCTQGLWKVLMGKNPSYFPDDDRPVEQVRWQAAVEFAQKLNERMAEGYPKDGRRLVEGWDRLMFRLPTEAEWEYACRAGTTSDTYAGDLEIIGDANAPLLDSIGWYGGNSGHEYDLRKSYSLEQRWLKERQYPEKAGGTRKVAQKTPNAWGLYDMLGNVWEWCQDWYGEYPAELTERRVDPTGPAQGAFRVIRGGSWVNPARYLRSACRFRVDPGTRDDGLGFRLLSSAHQAVQATESGEEASQGEIASGGRGTSPTTSDEP